MRNCVQQAHDRNTQQHRQGPTEDCEEHGAAFDIREIELHPSHEQGGRRTKGKHRFHEPIKVDQFKDVLTNHDSYEDFENYDGYLSGVGISANKGASTAAANIQKTG